MRSTRSIFFGVAAAATLIVYLTYVCLTKSESLQLAEEKIGKMQRLREQMTAQLQVVTEHRQRLEQSIEDYKSKMEALKEDAAKERETQKASLDEATRQVQRETLHRRQAEDALEAARLEHEQAYEELQKSKEDEVLRLSEALASQRRWCKQLEEKFAQAGKTEGPAVQPVQSFVKDDDGPDSDKLQGEGQSPDKDVRNFRGGAAISDPLGQHLVRDRAGSNRALSNVQGPLQGQRPDIEFNSNQQEKLAMRGALKQDAVQSKELENQHQPHRLAPAAADFAEPAAAKDAAVGGAGIADGMDGEYAINLKRGHHRQRQHDEEEAAADPRERGAADDGVARNDLQLDVPDADNEADEGGELDRDEPAMADNGRRVERDADFDKEA